MLQQTQVDRVIPFYQAFLKRFPTAPRLAAAPLSQVLRAWQGLGYNRRARYLHEAAKAIVARHGGAVPGGKDQLIALPGVGAYTAAAVRAFAWNKPDVFLETNIRTALIHRFFPVSRKVPDARLLPYLAAVLDRKRPRQWYAALMDYGAYLKRTEGNAARRSAHNVRQRPFKGSDREIRGAIVRLLSRASMNRETLFRSLPFPKPRIRAQLAALAREGMVTIARGSARLSR